MNNLYYIEQFTDNPSNENMDYLIELGRSNRFSDDELAHLAKVMANSGQCLDIPENIVATDIPSTGSPSSLSTLICPLILMEFGFWVPKLGVRGRPAGGIDVLYQIPGYKVEFTQNELISCLNINGYCHFLASENHAPLDAALFQYRSKVGASSIPALVIPSILSKKIAAGLTLTGLDIRVSEYGNFGNNWDEAIENGKRFIRVASIAGIKAKCMLNDFEVLQQPFIGRGESLVALKNIFTKNASPSLQSHFERCLTMSLELNDSINWNEENIVFRIEQHFKNNLKVQGATWNGFLEKTNTIEEGHFFKLNASKSGFVRINHNKLKYAIVWGQELFNSKNCKFSDPCGVIFKKMDNDFVYKGETILTFRADEKLMPLFEQKISDAITLNSKIGNNRIYEVLN